MNILTGIRLSGRTRDQELGAELLFNAVGMGAAVNALCIADAIDGKTSIRGKKLFKSVMSKIRFTAIQMSHKREQQEVHLDGADMSWVSDLAKLVKEGAVGVVRSTLKCMFEALYSGFKFVGMAVEMVSMVASVALGALRLAAGVVYDTFVAILTTPEISIPLAILAGGYLLYRKFQGMSEEMPDIGEPERGPGRQLNLGPQGYDYGAYQRAIGRRESGGHIGAVNSLGYVGKYQFGATALEDLGLVKPGVGKKGNAALNDPDNWTTKGGLQAFLADEPAQDDAFKRYTARHYRQLMEAGVITARSTPSEIAGYLAAAHLQGVGGAIALKNGASRRDAYGTTSQSYYSLGAGSQGGTFRVNPGAASFILPVNGRLSSGFGNRVAPTKGASSFHEGVDIAAPIGTPVYASNSGTVTRAGTANGYGNLIEIQGTNGATRYGHVSSMSVKRGDLVQQGQEIGKVGNAGVSTGPHLHFEIQPVTATAPVDPANYLPSLAASDKGQSVGVADNVTHVDYVRIDDKLIRMEN